MLKKLCGKILKYCIVQTLLLQFLLPFGFVLLGFVGFISLFDFCRFVLCCRFSFIFVDFLFLLFWSSYVDIYAGMPGTLRYGPGPT